MSERKVLNKYYPPDFDPAKIPRRKLAKDRQQVVRLMAPFSMQCLSCTEFIYKGKKFNARKEAAAGEHYFGIKIFRFYIKCPRCSNEITFKTDPKHSDYVAEHGAQRNFEPWREEEAAKNAGSDSDDDVERLLAAEQAELEEEQEDSMRSLEKNQVESKREMEILDKLQEIRTRNARLERSGNGRGVDGVLASVSSRIQSGLAGTKEILEQERHLQEAEEDEAEVAKYFSKVAAQPLKPLPSIEEHDGEEGPRASGSGSHLEQEAGDKDDLQQNGINPTPATTGPESITIKRKFTDVEPDVHSLLSEKSREMLATASGFTKLPPKKKKNATMNALGVKIKKKS
ncbi:hypothetical protein PtA15_5A529 [Puccinia triticina]|uniref:Splicing factor YJU2 n=1 Tax=Puccinia triticina TaxID=208348 RepID=A0ABY7CLD8_9BASI|nr:uncharacterized protein PtA15_5A529 [Puccinia triticina]WAQ84956.1 hypothetical protein PtA15_5A529 [Puccinia triticina]WAR58291.1 hypothetical protein PtB15_5B525 [Puccinia triticina]